MKARLGDQVFPSDVVTVDNRVLEKVQEYVYFAYNKPRGVSTTASTPGEKRHSRYHNVPPQQSSLSADLIKQVMD